jgi:hypothetical protein
VSGGFEVTVACFWLHFVGDKNVLATGNQIFFFQAEVGVTRGLIHDVTPLFIKNSGRTLNTPLHFKTRLI